MWVPVLSMLQSEAHTQARLLAVPGGSPAPRQGPLRVYCVRALPRLSLGWQPTAWRFPDACGPSLPAHPAGCWAATSCPCPPWAAGCARRWPPSSRKGALPACLPGCESSCFWSTGRAPESFGLRVPLGTVCRALSRQSAPASPPRPVKHLYGTSPTHARHACTHRLVWPENLSWRWGPSWDRQQAAQAGSGGGRALLAPEQQRRRQLPPPLGVLLVEVVGAELEPRWDGPRGQLAARPVPARPPPNAAVVALGVGAGVRTFGPAWNSSSGATFQSPATHHICLL